MQCAIPSQRAFEYFMHMYGQNVNMLIIAHIYPWLLATFLVYLIASAAAACPTHTPRTSPENPMPFLASSRQIVFLHGAKSAYGEN